MCGSVLASKTGISSEVAVELSGAGVPSLVASVLLVSTSGVSVTGTPMLASSRVVPCTCVEASLGCELSCGLV